MNYLLLSILSIYSIEITIKLKYFSLISSLFLLIQKTLKIINNRKISDSSKEKIVPTYSLKILKFSFLINLIILIILLPFVLANFYLDDFSEILPSSKGLFVFCISGFCYVYIKKFFK